MTDDDIAVLVEAPDPGVFGPFPVEAGRIESRVCFDDPL